MKRLYTILAIIASLVIAGCQPTPPPLDSVSIQNTTVAIGNTAVAIAWTSVAQTQNAPTPRPTNIPAAIPTKSSSSSSGSNNSNSGNNTSWFKGGTLHRATVREWRNATYANRLATSADFIAATQDVDFGDLEGFKRMAADLETCISTAVSGGDVDNEDVVTISAMCTVMLFP
jgi:hypothetical protein